MHSNFTSQDGKCLGACYESGCTWAAPDEVGQRDVAVRDVARVQSAQTVQRRARLRLCYGTLVQCGAGQPARVAFLSHNRRLLHRMYKAHGMMLHRRRLSVHHRLEAGSCQCAAPPSRSVEDNCVAAGGSGHICRLSCVCNRASSSSCQGTHEASRNVTRGMTHLLRRRAGSRTPPSASTKPCASSCGSDFPASSHTHTIFAASECQHQCTWSGSVQTGFARECQLQKRACLST